MKIFFKYLWILPTIFIVNLGMMPSSAWAEPRDDATRTVQGVIIIINDLIIVDDKGTVTEHVMKPDNSDLNVQTKVSGNVRVRNDGYWIFNKATTIEFLNAKMYLTDELTVPVTLEALPSELGDGETLNLPVLIKGENDTVGTRLNMQVKGSMMAGVLLQPKSKVKERAKK